MRFFARSDIGKVRQLNEDHYFCKPPYLGIVADGMGGHAAGEIASKLAVDSVLQYLAEQEVMDETVLKEAVIRANSAICSMSRQREECSGMGTTITMCCEQEDTLYWAHVGDSRMYLLRAGELRQMTQDHSYVGDLLRSGQITKEEARVHPKRNLLTRAVGAEREIEIDTGAFPMQAGDILLLCSDGLTNMVTEQEIQEELLRDRGELETAVARLIERANENGGTDNSTVLIAMK